MGEVVGWIGAGVAFEGPADRRERRNRAFPLDPTLDGSERQTRRERGIRIRARAEETETRLGDQRVLPLDDGLELVFHAFAQRPALGVHQQRQLDEGVAARLDGFKVADLKERSDDYVDALYEQALKKTGARNDVADDYDNATRTPGARNDAIDFNQTFDQI